MLTLLPPLEEGEGLVGLPLMSGVEIEVGSGGSRFISMDRGEKKKERREKGGEREKIVVCDFGALFFSSLQFLVLVNSNIMI